MNNIGSKISMQKVSCGELNALLEKQVELQKEHFEENMNDFSSYREKMEQLAYYHKLKKAYDEEILAELAIEWNKMIDKAFSIISEIKSYDIKLSDLFINK